MDPTEQAGMAGYKSTVYGLLAEVFRNEPGSALIEMIRAPAFLDALSEVGVELNGNFVNGNVDELVEELAIEYTRLFLGPGHHISPHESVHHELTDGRKWGTLWGDSTAEVKEFIESSGLELRPDANLIPDHISVELEFMQLLTKHEVETIRRGDKEAIQACHGMQRHFLEKHLSKWMPKFCGEVIERAENSFYRQIAEFAKSFVEFEYGNLKDKAGN